MAEKKQDAQPRQRYWRTTKKRAEIYAEEYKNGVHMYGKKEGQELTEKEKAKMRGYFQCLSDQAGHYKYNKAKKAGATKEEAAEYSRTIGKSGESIWDKIFKRKKN